MGGLPSHVGIQVAGCRRQVHGDCSSHQGNTACSMHMHCCCCRRREHPGGLRVPRCRIVKVVVVSLTCRTRCSSIPGQNELHAQQPVNCGTVSATTGEVFSQLKKEVGEAGRPPCAQSPNWSWAPKHSSAIQARGVRPGLDKACEDECA